MGGGAVTEVTKDFDQERAVNGAKPTTFSVGGQKFTVRPYVSADVLGEFGRRQVSHFGDTLDAYDKLVKECIAEDEAAKWDKVRHESDPPLTIGAIEQIVFWLIDSVSGRPTEAPSSSRRGRAVPAAT
jgi:hypothetical protein